VTAGHGGRELVSRRRGKAALGCWSAWAFLRPPRRYRLGGAADRRKGAARGRRPVPHAARSRPRPAPAPRLVKQIIHAELDGPEMGWDHLTAAGREDKEAGSR